MARPKELNQDVLVKARSYLTSYQTPVPSRVGLALHLGIHRDTVYDWESKSDLSDEYEEFSDIVKDVDALQEQTLFSMGLTNEFNASITKLMLTKHGYSDKTQQELTGASGGDLVVQIVKLGDQQ